MSAKNKKIPKILNISAPESKAFKIISSKVPEKDDIPITNNVLFAAKF